MRCTHRKKTSETQKLTFSSSFWRLVVALEANIWASSTSTTLSFVPPIPAWSVHLPKIHKYILFTANNNNMFFNLQKFLPDNRLNISENWTLYMRSNNDLLKQKNQPKRHLACVPLEEIKQETRLLIYKYSQTDWCSYNFATVCSSKNPSWY